MMLEELTDLEIAQKLAAEMKNAPQVHFILDATTAFHLVGLLLLACRHPQIRQHDVELVRKLCDQVKAIGPAVAESINMGWDPTKDNGTRRS